ncbi:MAG: hypothetical protein ACRDNT_04455 [Streptosporangiaceae bacterium]
MVEVGQPAPRGRSRRTSACRAHVTAWHTEDTAYAYDDILAINDYDGWYYEKASDIGADLDAVQSHGGNKPMALSEYGAEAVLGRGGTGPGREYYQAQLVDTYNAELANRPYLLGMMCWTSTEFACQ